jgi:hypothetical protein
MDESQVKHLATIRQENEEMRQYVVHLHNDLDVLNISTKRRLKTFSLQFENVD